MLMEGPSRCSLGLLVRGGRRNGEQRKEGAVERVKEFEEFGRRLFDGTCDVSAPPETRDQLFLRTVRDLQTLFPLPLPVPSTG